MYLFMIYDTIVFLFKKRNDIVQYDFCLNIFKGLTMFLFAALIYLFAFGITLHDYITLYLASPLIIDL